MDVLDEFLERYREQLLGRLTRLDPQRHRTARDNVDSKSFVHHVLAAWSKLPCEARRSSMRSGERTFWHALYTMEDLTELPVDGNVLDPFEGLLLNELMQARRLLETRTELPHGNYASRPNGR